MLLIGATIWVLCGIIAAVIYQSKKRSGLAGFAGGFLLGPLGILLAVLSPTYDATQDDLRAGKLRKCPKCAELVKSEASICRYCGAELAPVKPWAPPLCPTCGKKLLVGATECPYCKQKVSTVGYPPPP